MNRRVPVETKYFACRRCGDHIGLQVRGAKAAAESLCRSKRSELSCGVWSRRSARRWARGRPTTSAALSSAALSTATSLRNATRSNADAATSAQIQTLHRAALRLGIDDVVISRIDLSVETIAAADAIPVSIRDSVLKTSRLIWPPPRAVVLQAAVDVVRLTHIDSDSV